MSIPLLNSECLAHIFSFSDYSTLANVRLACRQFNQIIKKYKVQKIRVKSININWNAQTYCIHSKIIPQPTEYEELVFGLNARKRKFRYKITDAQTIQQALRTFLTKIEHSDNVYFSDFDIDNKFLLISQKFGDRFGNCNHLIFQRCTFSLSPLYMNYLIEVIQPKQVNFHDCRFPNNKIISAECLAATPVTIRNNPSLVSVPLLSMDDKYLESFGDRIFDVSFNFYGHLTGFTFHTVRRLVNERLDKEKYSGLWSFGIITYGNWRLSDYNNFCQYYRASKYHCRHSINSNTADVLIYIPTELTGLDRVNGCTINIHFEVEERA